MDSNKILRHCLLLVTAAVIGVHCYNFDDYDFNQILANDLQELYDGLDQVQAHPRSRRDEEAVQTTEKCRGRRKKPCCADETMEKIKEAEREWKQNCFKEIHGKDKEPKSEKGFDPFSCDRVDRHRREMTCVTKCVGQKRNILDDSGDPKEEEFKEFVKETFAKEAWFGSLQDKIISTCLAEARNATSMAAVAADKEKDACNPAGVKLQHCMFRETQLNCPKDQIKDEKSCQRLQDRLRSKGGDFPPPPPHGDFLHDE